MVLNYDDYKFIGLVRKRLNDHAVAHKLPSSVYFIVSKCLTLSKTFNVFSHFRLLFLSKFSTYLPKPSCCYTILKLYVENWKLCFILKLNQYRKCYILRQNISTYKLSKLQLCLQTFSELESPQFPQSLESLSEIFPLELSTLHVKMSM